VLKERQVGASNMVEANDAKSWDVARLFEDK
jgi:hypothetical protein